MIQKNHVIMLFSDFFQTCFSSFSRINLYLCFLKQCLHNSDVHFNVIYYKNTCMRCSEPLWHLYDIFPLFLNSVRIIADWFVADHSLRNRHTEYGAFPIFTFNRYFSIHQKNKLSGNGKAKPCAFNSTILYFIQTFIGSKKFFHILRFDSDSGIFYSNIQINTVSGYHLISDMKFYISFPCIFYCV